MTQTSPPDWTAGFFDDWYEQLFPFPGPDITDAEVAGLHQVLPPSPARILDAACGVGRHAVRLAAMGYRVTALDSSALFLERVRDTAAQLQVELDVVEGDLRTITYENEFDAVVNLGTAWGYYDEAGNRLALERMAGALRRGGTFVLDLSHRDWIVAHFNARDWRQLEDGTIIWIERAFDPVAGTAWGRHRWRRPDGSGGEREHQVRLYTATEVDRLLADVGLQPQVWYGGLSLQPLAIGERRLVVVATGVDDT